MIGTSDSTVLPLRLDWVVRMRGVAALCVFAFHVWAYAESPHWHVTFFGARISFWPWFHAGAEGVSLFFVLSGFVIAWPYLVSRQTCLDRASVVDFYQRRLLRIAPVYYASIAVALALAAGGWAPRVDGSVVALHLLFAQNFDPAIAGAINRVYWTLPTELHYYLIFPLLLRWAPIARPAWIAATGVALALAYRCFSVWSGDHGMWLSWTAAYLPGRIDQFAAGFAAACAVVRARRRGVTVSRRAVSLAIVAGVAITVIATHEASDTHGWRFLLGPSLLALSFGGMLYLLGVYALGSAAQPARPRARELGSKLLYAIGLSSLSLYLWHTTFLDIATQLASSAGWSPGARLAAIVATVPIAIGFSWLTYWLIERPFVRLSKSHAWRRRLGVRIQHTPA